MKVLHVIHSADPAGGGVVECLRQLGSAQAAAGHTVEIVSLDPPASPWEADFPLPIHALGPGRGGYGHTPRLVPWLREHGRAYDVVVANGLWQYHGFGTWQAFRDSRVPYCVFAHGMLDRWFRQGYPVKHFKKWLYWQAIEHRVLRDAAAVLFTCEEEMLEARDTFRPYQVREQVVPIGTAGPAGDAASQRALFAETFPELRDKRLLLFLGRVHSKKGCADLLRSFGELCRRSPAALHLVMAGPVDASYAEELRGIASASGVAACVSWLGMLRGDLKWGAFHSAEAFVLPSYQENFGVAVAEALACGLPVLISKKVNIWREIVSDGGGLAEDPGEAGTLRLLERWVGMSEDERRAVQSAARRCFETRFEIGAAASRWMDLVGDVVASARRAS